MRDRLIGILLLLLISVIAYGSFVAIMIVISPLTGSGSQLNPFLHNFLYYWDSIVILFFVYAVGAGFLNLFGYAKRAWIVVYIICATLLVILTFRSESYSNELQWAIRHYLHYAAPALGALVGSWISSQLLSKRAGTEENFSNSGDS